jgi:hypothetical protein
LHAFNKTSAERVPIVSAFNESRLFIKCVLNVLSIKLCQNTEWPSIT